jgi:hypothetical protein
MDIPTYVGRMSEDIVSSDLNEIHELSRLK